MKTTVQLDSKDIRQIIARFLGIPLEDVIPNRYNFSENFPKYISRIADVYSSTGVAVTAGQCVIFELHGSEEDTPTYVYFE